MSSFGNVLTHLLAPDDYTTLNIPENRPSFFANNVLNYRGGDRQDSVIQFVITTKVDSEDIIEPSEAFLLNISPVRTAIVLTPQLEVVICPGKFRYYLLKSLPKKQVHGPICKSLKAFLMLFCTPSYGCEYATTLVLCSYSIIIKVGAL